MKVRIPQEHYEFYRKLYKYLNHTVEEDTDQHLNEELVQILIGNYLDRHRKGIPLDHLLENETPKSAKGKYFLSHKSSIISQPSLNSDEKKNQLSELHKKISLCQDCYLGKFRKQYVTLPPPPPSPIMVIVDIPSYYDQTQGKYFKDEAGTLIKNILKSISLDLRDIYYTAAIKCTHSQEITNRLFDATACRKHIIKEIHILKPQLILAFGKTTYDFLMLEQSELENQEFIDSKEFASYAGEKLSFHGIDIVFTHHPRDLLIHPELKKETWNHLKKYIEQIEELKITL